MSSRFYKARALIWCQHIYKQVVKSQYYIFFSTAILSYMPKLNSNNKEEPLYKIIIHKGRKRSQLKKEESITLRICSRSSTVGMATSTSESKRPPLLNAGSIAFTLMR